MNKRFGKNDLILLAVLLAAAALGFYFFYFQNRPQGDQVLITIDGTVYGTYSLNGEQEIQIPDASGTTTNVLSIRDGKAKMIEASCPDKLCEYQNAISKSGESIICLPNKVVVTVTGGQEDDTIDAFSK